MNELTNLEGLSEELLLEAIQQRVNDMIDENPELLISYLYRLDIEEHKISAVMNGLTNEDPIEGISRLILERQKERIKTKIKNKQDPIEGWEY